MACCIQGGLPGIAAFVRGGPTIGPSAVLYHGGLCWPHHFCDLCVPGFCREWSPSQLFSQVAIAMFLKSRLLTATAVEA